MPMKYAPKLEDLYSKNTDQVMKWKKLLIWTSVFYIKPILTIDIYLHNHLNSFNLNFPSEK